MILHQKRRSSSALSARRHKEWPKSSTVTGPFQLFRAKSAEPNQVFAVKNTARCTAVEDISRPFHRHLLHFRKSDKKAHRKITRALNPQSLTEK